MKARNAPESVILAEAIKVGVKKLWKESVLGARQARALRD